MPEDAFPEAFIHPTIHAEAGMLWINATHVTLDRQTQQVRESLVILLPRTPIAFLGRELRHPGAVAARSILKGVLSMFPALRSRMITLVGFDPLAIPQSLPLAAGSRSGEHDFVAALT